jgi:streptogramin lyase
MTRRVAVAISVILAVGTAGCGSSGTASTAVSSLPSPSGDPTPVPAELVIATGPGPIILTATSDSVWVELHRADSVARIDPTTNLQAEPLEIGVHCTLAASGNSVWATFFRMGTVTRFDATTGKALQSFDLAACGLAVDGDTAWVTAPGDGAVYLLQEGAAEPIRRIALELTILDIALDETSAWVTSEIDGGALWRIDRSTYEATRIGQFPGLDAVEVAFGSVWLTARSQSHLWKLDPADGSVLGELDLPQPSGVVPVDDALWITTYDGGLVELDPETLEIRSERELRYGNLGPPIYAFGSLWVSALEANAVLRVSLDRR